MSEQNLALTDRFFAAIEAQDPAAVAAYYTEDVQVWHNFDNRCQNKADNVETLSALCASVDHIRYETVERLLLPDGRVMQRHLLRASVTGQAEVVIPACIFLTFSGAQICRIDEYLDTAQANELRKMTGRAPVDAD